MLKYIESPYIGIANITVVPEAYRRELPRIFASEDILIKTALISMLADRMPFTGLKITIYGGWISAEPVSSMFSFLGFWSRGQVKMLLWL